MQGRLLGRRWSGDGSLHINTAHGSTQQLRCGQKFLPDILLRSIFPGVCKPAGRPGQSFWRRYMLRSDIKTFPYLEHSTIISGLRGSAAPCGRAE